ncbi:MAG: hypothetical protein ACI9NT_001751 [Bacteroidia bacterium]
MPVIQRLKEQVMIGSLRIKASALHGRFIRLLSRWMSEKA